MIVGRLYSTWRATLSLRWEFSPTSVAAISPIIQCINWMDTTKCGSVTNGATTTKTDISCNRSAGSHISCSSNARSSISILQNACSGQNYIVTFFCLSVTLFLDSILSLHGNAHAIKRSSHTLAHLTTGLYNSFHFARLVKQYSIWWTNKLQLHTSDNNEAKSICNLKHIAAKNNKKPL
jgi:hypothetical protein